MEFGGWGSEGFGDLFSEDEELELAVEGLDKSGNDMLIEFDLDSPFGPEEDVIFMDKQVMERFHEVESGLSEMISKPTEPRSVENLGVGNGVFSGDDMNAVSPDCGLSSFSLLGEYDESWSGNSSCGLELSSSVVNSEMGRQEAESDEMSKARPEASVEDSSRMDKQANMECLSSTNVTCQVEGCNADLTSSKDYYKRHRVCPVDTKKATVIVNGIQKRFCQQCSRFHLLNEFDDDKRSCRKRLAGHNKRRRKPRFENRLHRPHKFQPYQYQGSRLQGVALPPRRHLSADQLPARVLFPDIYEQINGLKHQGTTIYGPTYATTTTNFPSSRSPCLGAEYYTPPETPSTVQNPSGVLDASYALSLLSNQPQVSFPYLTTTPIIIQGHNIFHRSATDLSFPSAHIFQANQIGPRILPGTLNPVAFMVSGNHDAGSLCSNCSNGLVPPQPGSTVDLRQLSFNLSRVEHQRHVP